MVKNENNLVEFTKPTSNSFSDNDIKSLFMGLVKLVKERAREEAEEKYLSEILSKNKTIEKIMNENRLLLEKCKNEK